MPRVTLNDFFGVSVNGFWQDVRPELLSAFREGGLAQLTAAQWPAVLSGIIDKAKDLFDIDFAAVIASTWSKYRELVKYADRKKYPPDTSNLVPMAKHTLSVDYHPYLEVLLNGKPLGKLVFDVTLSLELEGFVLTIQDGRIMKVHTGSCQGKGKIAFKGSVLVEKSLTKIALPGMFDLGEGMSLKRSDAGSKDIKVEQPPALDLPSEKAVEKPTVLSAQSGRRTQEDALAQAYWQGML